MRRRGVRFPWGLTLVIHRSDSSTRKLLQMPQNSKTNRKESIVTATVLAMLSYSDYQEYLIDGDFYSAAGEHYRKRTFSNIPILTNKGM
ncbi:unnamed protein product [Gongylonema pulchrum]|uniref:Transposase n=1 Tax=Gongylonema pulchrum TaxID=637853 RepID=A0A183EK01_9BILA|nr:unnamed protein product [Gongylonema pulchrum]